MAGRAPTVPKVPFDETKFAALVEPIAVRVERITGNARMPIPLPVSDDPSDMRYSTTVDGWSKDDVRQLENWLVSAWTGGGLYDISLTDSSAQPITMKWSPYWDPREYPIKVPPPLETVARQQPQPQVIRPMSAFPNGLPQNLPMMPQGQPQQQSFYGYGPQYAMGQPPAYGTHAYAQWRDEAADRRREDELSRLREEKAQREREAIIATHRAELERERVAAEARMSRQDSAINELRTMLASLTQTINQQVQKPQGETSEVAALKAQLEAQRQQQEAERRDLALREMIKTTQEATQRQIDALMRQFEQQAQIAREAAANNRHDPLVAMMQEQNRLNTDALKAMAQENARSIERLQGFMMTPNAMFDLATRQTQAVDSVTDKITRQFEGIVGLQQKVTENALQMQPGGSTAVDVVRDGVNGLKEMVERYTGMKTAEQRLAANAQIEIARAQAAAIAAQHGMSMAHAQQPSQLAGMPTAPSIEARKHVPDNVTPITSAKKPIERFGRTDEEWFGPLFPEVAKLRGGVARFIESLTHTPPRMKDNGEIDGVSPEQAALAVLQVVQIVMQNNAPIQAVVDLLAVDRFDDFFMVIMPDAPKTYREDATRIFVETVQRLQGLAGEDIDQSDGNDVDADDDGVDPDDGDNDEPIVSRPKPASKPSRRIQ